MPDSTSGRPAAVSVPPPEQQLLAEIATRVEGVFASVQRLGEAAISLITEASGSGHGLGRADLLGLYPLVSEALTTHRGFTAGAGLVMAPGVLDDAPLWLDWHWAGEDGALERLEVDLDPDSAEFYDYTTTEWYREPLRTGKRHIAGPYVDYICTHEYTFTLSIPLLDGERFLGVAAADVLAAQVERLVSPALARLGCVAALASGNGRVISSNSSSLTPGVVLTRDRLGSALRAVAGPGDASLQNQLPWVLLEEVPG